MKPLLAVLQGHGLAGMFPSPLRSCCWPLQGACLVRFAHWAACVFFFSPCGAPHWPIGGGVLSKIAASIVLGAQEHALTCDVSRRKQQGFASTCDAWDMEVACAHYVDDLPWDSSVYCWSCMATAIRRSYTVLFELEPECSKVCWLDVTLDLSSFEWEMMLKPWVLPPHFGAPLGYARGLHAGCLARWCEVSLSENGFTDAAVNLLLGFRDAGWRKQILRAAIYQTSHANSRRRTHLLLRALLIAWR